MTWLDVALACVLVAGVIEATTPWCWLVPLLLLAAVGVGLALRRSPRGRRRKDRTGPLGHAQAARTREVDMGADRAPITVLSCADTCPGGSTDTQEID